MIYCENSCGFVCHQLGQIDHCILSLELNVKIQAKNTVVCMASLLSSNGHMSSHFDTIHVKLSTHAYFALFFHTMLSDYETSKNKFYDIITSVLYSCRVVLCQCHVDWCGPSSLSAKRKVVTIVI